MWKNILWHDNICLIYGMWKNILWHDNICLICGMWKNVLWCDRALLLKYLFNFSKNVFQRVAVYVKQLDSERLESWFLVVTSHVCSDIENLVGRKL